MTKSQELALVLHSISLRLHRAVDTGHEVSLGREWDRIYDEYIDEAARIRAKREELRRDEEARYDTR